LVLIFRDQTRDEPTWRVCARALGDLALTVPLQHLEARMHRNATPALTVVAVAVAVAGLGLALVGGTSATPVLVGLSLALAAGAFAVATWRHGSPPAAPSPTAHWWKLVLAGPVLIGGVIVASGLGVEAWSLGLAVVFVAFALIATGAVLGLVRLVGSFHGRV
jgi:hypothetical protein